PAALADEVEQRVIEKIGVSVQQANPFDAVDPVQLPEQAVERGAVAPLAPVRGQILRDQIDLLDAVARERRRLRDDRVDRPAAVRPAELRNDAKGALVIASFR